MGWAARHFPRKDVLRRTLDGGATWTEITIVDPRTRAPHVLSWELALSRVVVEPSNPFVLYLLGSLSLRTPGCEVECVASYSSVYPQHRWRRVMAGLAACIDAN
jgi:hypothetical protein